MTVIVVLIGSVGYDSSCIKHLLLHNPESVWPVNFVWHLRLSLGLDIEQASLLARSSYTVSIWRVLHRRTRWKRFLKRIYRWQWHCQRVNTKRKRKRVDDYQICLSVSLMMQHEFPPVYAFITTTLQSEILQKKSAGGRRLSVRLYLHYTYSI